MTNKMMMMMRRDANQPIRSHPGPDEKKIRMRLNMRIKTSSEEKLKVT